MADCLVKFVYITVELKCIDKKLRFNIWRILTDWCNFGQQSLSSL